MSFVQSIPELESALEDIASTWVSLSVNEYQKVTADWMEVFLPHLDSKFLEPTTESTQRRNGKRALDWIVSKLPVDVFLLSGLKMPSLNHFTNMGGCGTALYELRNLRSLPKDLLIQFEPIIISIDFQWSCVFSHEGNISLFSR